MGMLFRTLYFTNRFWSAGLALIAAFVLAFVYPVILPVCDVLLALLLLFVVADITALYRVKRGIFARRSMADRMSNGDDNPITIFVENSYRFKVAVELVDEIPFQFQRRDVSFKAGLAADTSRQIHYELRPVSRGVYSFGKINVFAKSPVGLIQRRFQFEHPREVAVYPSYLKMRQYSLLAVANRLNEAGIRRIRKVGHSMEFDQVRGYVQGDDRRVVNWKASARRGDLMVNTYEDEKQQSVYCLIDKGRVMQSPFEGLTLLDYAINASLILSNIALMKADKAGLVTFSDTMGQIVPADRRTGHMQRILEVLYHQKTKFLESDYERLCVAVRHRIRHRSLLLLFTNFETVEGMQRQLPYLRALNRDHLLVVILFENTETRHLIEQTAEDVEGVYQKAIAQRFYYEKKRIVAELRKFGIQAILTSPAQLTANTINKYLELKSRGAI